jgi:hypothetical protein
MPYATYRRTPDWLSKPGTLRRKLFEGLGFSPLNPREKQPGSRYPVLPSPSRLSIDVRLLYEAIIPHVHTKGKTFLACAIIERRIGAEGHALRGDGDSGGVVRAERKPKMATNPPKGDGHRRGAVRDRSQVFNPETQQWVKRDGDTGRFMDVKKDGEPFKGVRKEK